MVNAKNNIDKFVNWVSMECSINDEQKIFLHEHLCKFIKENTYTFSAHTNVPDIHIDEIDHDDFIEGVKQKFKHTIIENIVNNIPMDVTIESNTKMIKTELIIWRA